eukprot:1183696-Prorocentrum_minimum.AAC.1
MENLLLTGKNLLASLVSQVVKPLLSQLATREFVRFSRPFRPFAGASCPCRTLAWPPAASRHKHGYIEPLLSEFAAGECDSPPVFGGRWAPCRCAGDPCCRRAWHKHEAAGAGAEYARAPAGGGAAGSPGRPEEPERGR